MPNSRDNRFCGIRDDTVQYRKQRRASAKRGNMGGPPFHHWRPSRTHKYIEVLVVCDKYFMDRHRHIDVQNYVLTIFNMVNPTYIISVYQYYYVLYNF